MSEPASATPPAAPRIRLGELIAAIRQVRREPLDQLAAAVIAARHLDEGGRPPHRPLRRPGQALRDITAAVARPREIHRT